MIGRWHRTMALAMVSTALSAGAADAQTRYFARQHLVGVSKTANPSTPPVETADGSDARATCTGTFRSGSIGGGTGGGNTKYAYSSDEAMTICNSLAWQYGKGACQYVPSEGSVRYAYGSGEFYPAASTYSYGVQCGAAAAGTPKPAPPPPHNEESGASCTAAPAQYMQAIGGTNVAGNRKDDVGSAEEARAFCNGLAQQYGEGVCRWDRDDRRAYYVMDGRAFEGYSYTYAANCS